MYTQIYNTFSIFVNKILKLCAGGRGLAWTAAWSRSSIENLTLATPQLPQTGSQLFPLIPADHQHHPITMSKWRKEFKSPRKLTGFFSPPGLNSRQDGTVETQETQRGSPLFLLISYTTNSPVRSPPQATMVSPLPLTQPPQPALPKQDLEWRDQSTIRTAQPPAYFLSLLLSNHHCWTCSLHQTNPCQNKQWRTCSCP